MTRQNLYVPSWKQTLRELHEPRCTSSWLSGVPKFESTTVAVSGEPPLVMIAVCIWLYAPDGSYHWQMSPAATVCQVCSVHQPAQAAW